MEAADNRHLYATKPMKYALVHEWLTPYAKGGSELVVQAMLQQYPADLYALIDFESINPDSYLYGRDIGTTFLQHFPLAARGVQKYLPLLPLAIEQLNLTDYDVILSSSHAVAKGVITTPYQCHVCYCHTPMRYAWDLTFDYLNNSRAGRGLPGVLTRYLLHRLRQWDVISANRVDYFLANSHHTARRIWRCYRREAAVLYPPVDVDRFSYQPQKADFFLTVSRLVSYKQIKLIVQAFNQLQLPLVVIGDGPDFKDLQAMVKDNITLMGSQPNDVVETYMGNARGFIYAACEDFGIAPVEAQACGTPVIALGRGGTCETVLDYFQNPDKATGLWFKQQTVCDLVQAVETFCEIEHHITSEDCLRQAQTFSSRMFLDSLTQLVDQYCQAFFAR